MGFKSQSSSLSTPRRDLSLKIIVSRLESQHLTYN